MIWEGGKPWKIKLSLLGLQVEVLRVRLLSHNLSMTVLKACHRVKIIKQDDYYKDQSDKTMEERVKTNYRSSICL